MTIKQILTRIITMINYYYSCFLGYCPTSGAIENSNVKHLADRLKAESYEETLANILEWQERNIEFWTERHPIHTLFTYVYGIIFLAFAILFICPIIIILILVALGIQTVALEWLVQIAIWFVQNIWWFIAFLVSATITIVAVMVSILHSNRKFPWKEIPKGLGNIFAPTISINFLLEKKLGVCRDYAKLTACLLSNIYPDAEIYFASAPSHAATGINIENRLYMLDQRLPILTIDRWKDYRKPRKWHGIEKFDPAKKTLRGVDKRTFLHPKDVSELNTERLAKTMIDFLKIKEQSEDKATATSLEKSIPIPWKKGAILYEDDEMVNYSLARHLKNEISNELMKMDQIIGIGVERYKDDIVFLIHVKTDQ